MHLVEEEGAWWSLAVAHRPLWEAEPPHGDVELEGPSGARLQAPSPGQDAAVAARSHRNPLPELDKGSLLLLGGSHPNTSQQPSLGTPAPLAALAGPLRQW